jgi:hypothetical protein
MGGSNTQSRQLNQSPDSIRTDGTTKGSGFLGGIKRLDDPSKVSSELSIGVDWGSGEKLIPQMVPTLDDNEIKYLLSTSADKIKTENPDLNKSITQKAVRFAKEREALGLPYFAQENESPKQKTESIYGYPIRKPYQSESDFFKNRPEVAGMATEDKAITLNPYSKNTPAQQNLVAQNEAIRQYLKENKVSPSFNLTPEQETEFSKTEYGKSKDKNPLKHSIIARILTGDPSAVNPTQEQINQANSIKQKLESLTKKPASSYDVINAEL